jgi:hypothetical protein
MHSRLAQIAAVVVTVAALGAIPAHATATNPLERRGSQFAAVKSDVPCTVARAQSYLYLACEEVGTVQVGFMIPIDESRPVNIDVLAQVHPISVEYMASNGLSVATFTTPIHAHVYRMTDSQ